MRQNSRVHTQIARPAEMSWRRAGPGLVVVGFAVVLAAAGGALGAALAGGPGDGASTTVGVDAVLGLAFPTLGTFILARGGPRRLAWLCLVPGLGALAFAADAYAGRAGGSPGAQWAVWVALWAWAPTSGHTVGSIP